MPPVPFSLVAVLLAGLARGLDNGLALTPPMGTNSWTAVGTGVSANFLLDTASLLASTGLQKAGYNIVCSDDGWSLGQRDADGLLVAGAWPA
jgi:alpha-galactosidase